MPILILLIAAAEVVLLVRLGAFIGGPLVLALLLGTGAIGWLLLRSRHATEVPQIIVSALAGKLRHDKTIARESQFILGALLLVLPGVLTDIAGAFFLLRYLFRRRRSPRDQGPRSRSGTPPQEQTIDVDFKVLDHEDDRNQ